MMEPSNLDHRHHHHHLGGSCSFAAPSSHLAGGASNEWNPADLILNTEDPNISAIGVLPSSKSPPTSSMVQELGLHWPYITQNYTYHSTHQEDFLAKIKPEPPDSFTQYPLASYDKHGLSYPSDLRRGNYSVVLPTANVSGIGLSSFSPAPFRGTGFQGLDLLAPGSNLALLREIGGFEMGCLHQAAAHEEPSENHSEISSVLNVMKRNNSVSDSNGSMSSAAASVKKPRADSRPNAFSPFKVRKEKLGDRIAALQQLVAPFGKTDTASVLMEAIGYIKFLQNQVQTLSVPYMTSSSSKMSAPYQEVPGGDADQESRLDLRSRGLCLVPLSCTSYFTTEDVGLWPSQDSRRGY